MTAQTARLIFGALCVAGIFAIGAGIFFEFGRLKRGNAVLSQRQMRWRVLGGCLWLLVLGSLAYATFFLWPSGATAGITGKRFAAVVMGSMALMVVAMIITAFDAFLTVKGVQLQREKFERDAGNLARAEIERIQAEHTDKPKPERPRE